MKSSEFKQAVKTLNILNPIGSSESGEIQPFVSLT